MPDLRLRVLERRYQETNSLDDWEAYLRASTRSGFTEAALLRDRFSGEDDDLTQLEIAALLGHPPAREALAGLERRLATPWEATLVFGHDMHVCVGQGCPVVRRYGRDRFDLGAVFAWFRGNDSAQAGQAQVRWPSGWLGVLIDCLGHHDPQIALCVASQAVRLAVEETLEGAPAACELLEAVQAWIERPSRRRSQAVSRLTEALPAGLDSPATQCIQGCHDLACAVTTRAQTLYAGRATEGALCALSRQRGTDEEDFEWLLAEIRERIVPWLLLGQPLSG